VQPGMVGAKRYPRTFNGLIASMILLVVAVVSCSVLQNANHRTISNAACSPVNDWQSAVVDAQAAGVELSYPGAIPAGWKVTSATWDNDPANQMPRWRIGLHNADCSEFAGLIEEQASAKILSQAVGPAEVSKTLPGAAKMVIVAHATSQQSLDQFVASLTTAKLSR